MSIKHIVSTFMLTASVAALADASVMDVKFTPRTPWNGLVDIEYTIACENPQDEVYVNPVAYDGDRKLTLFMNCLTGDGITNTVKAGKHKMTWDSITDYGVFSSANFQIKMYAGKRMPRYIKIDLSSGAESDSYPVTMSLVGPDLSNDVCRTTELWLRLVLPGEFWMGSPTDELGRTDNEDLHHVTLTKPFYLGVFEVTQKQYELVMGSNPSYFKETDNWPTRPVESVGYNMIRGEIQPASNELAQDSFLTRIRTRTHSLSFDLPSEARWEYACRAGSTTALYNGKNLSNVDACAALNEIARNFANGWSEIAQSVSNATYGTSKVGSYKANRLGLYDMLGNVWECCRDGGFLQQSYSVQERDYDAPSLGVTAAVDPLRTDVRMSGDSYYHYVSRGGAYNSRATYCRSSRRISTYHSRSGNSWITYDHLGFRVCSELEFYGN